MTRASFVQEISANFVLQDVEFLTLLEFEMNPVKLCIVFLLM